MNGVSATSVNCTATLVRQFPTSILEQIIVYPRLPSEITWENIPRCVKEQSEMTFYNGYELEDAYRIYGVNPARGALVVVRPDGYVGMVTELCDISRVDTYLSHIITRDK